MIPTIFHCAAALVYLFFLIPLNTFSFLFVFLPTGYLADRSEWSDYDATELVGALQAHVFDDVLIDVGTADSFLTGGQLLPEVILFCGNYLISSLHTRFIIIRRV